MKAPSFSTATDRLPKVRIERDDDEVVDERIVDDNGIEFACQTGLPGTDDLVAAALEKQGHRLDHVLVGEKR